MNPKYARVLPQNNWWRLDGGWIGFGEKPFDDREIGLIWQIGRFEQKVVHLPGNRYRYEPNTDGTMTAYASKGMDGQPWQQSHYAHESKTVEELRAWVEKKARNMARGYRRERDYRQGLKEAEAERRAKLAANVGDR